MYVHHSLSLFVTRSYPLGRILVSSFSVRRPNQEMAGLTQQRLSSRQEGNVLFEKVYGVASSSRNVGSLKWPSSLKQNHFLARI